MTNKDGSLMPVVRARSSARNVWDPGAPYRRVGGFGSNAKFFRSSDRESLRPEWTTVEVYTLGNAGAYLVNGRVVSAFRDAKLQRSNGKAVPLTRGKIQIQSEGAEMFIREVTLTPITEFPASIRREAGFGD